jgi:hypothetical protein
MNVQKTENQAGLRSRQRQDEDNDPRIFAEQNNRDEILENLIMQIESSPDRLGKLARSRLAVKKRRCQGWFVLVIKPRSPAEGGKD